MTLPARKDDHLPHPPRKRTRWEEKELAEQLRERIALAERAALAAAEEAQARMSDVARAEKAATPERFGIILLVWSCVALLISMGILAYETLGPGAAARAIERPQLEFSDLNTRFVQSAEGPAVEITGILRNTGDRPAKPEFTLQLVGNRVAIEEPLKLGGAALPSGAERPFAVRLLVPNGTQQVSLLPPQEGTSSEPDMVLVSPAWTAETPGY